MQVTIHSIPEFIKLLNERSFTSAQICKVLEKGFKIFADENLKPAELKKQITAYWNKYAGEDEKPIFIDDSIDVEEYLKSQTTKDRPGFLTEYKTLKAAKVASLHYKTGMYNNEILLLGDVVATFK